MYYHFNRPLNVSPAYSFLDDDYSLWAPYVDLIRDVSIGEIAVKSRGQIYLMPLEDQSDSAFQRYLERAVFVNYVYRTVSGLTGTLFSKCPEIESVPEDYDLTSSTKDGISFLAMARTVAQEIVSVGRVGVLVDASPDGGPSYCSIYLWEDILNQATTRINGRDVVSYVVLRETQRNKSKTTGETQLVENLRELVLENGVYKQRIYEGTDLGGVYTEITPLANGQALDRIPFTFLTHLDITPNIYKPPVLDIALINVRHYNTYALLNSGRLYSAYPTYVVFTDEGQDGYKFKIGPGSVWQLGTNDKCDILDYKGDGLAGFERDLSLMEQQMSALGAKMAGSLRGTAAESAESAQLREKNEYNLLSSVAAALSEGLTRVLQWMLYFDGRLSYRVNGDLVVYHDAHVEFIATSDDSKATAREIRAIQTLYETGLLPVEALYAIFIDAEILPKTMSLSEFRQSLPNISPKVQQEIIKTSMTERIKAKTSLPRQQPNLVTKSKPKAEDVEPEEDMAGHMAHQMEEEDAEEATS